MATNAAMVLAKDAGKKPRDLAENIAAILRADDKVASVDVAGPGFINLSLKPNVWGEGLLLVLAQGEDYGRSAVGEGEKVNVEYVSANPTGPMHVGHGRGAVFGDALANLLLFAGYDVTREYYINDAGAQVEVLARSAFLRYREALGADIGAIPDGLYPGDYLKQVGGELAAEYGAKLIALKESEWLPVVRAKAIDMLMNVIRNDLAALNVHFDVFFSERSLIEGKRDEVRATIESLRKSGEVYEGRLPPPKGGNLEAPLRSISDGRSGAACRCASDATLAQAAGVTHWICENAKSARAFLKRVGEVRPSPRRCRSSRSTSFRARSTRRATTRRRPSTPRPCSRRHSGHDMALLSEAGMPAVADPGSSVVRAAHELGMPSCHWSGRCRSCWRSQRVA